MVFKAQREVYKARRQGEKLKLTWRIHDTGMETLNK